MILLSFDRIRQKPSRGTDASKTMPHYREAADLVLRPFLPGQVYLVKDFGGAVVSTILDRSDTTVTVTEDGKEETLNRFNMRVVSYLGHRASVFGIWLPWIILQPRILVNDLSPSAYNDPGFWSITRDDVQEADAQPAPEQAGMTHIPNGLA